MSGTNSRDEIVPSRAECGTKSVRDSVPSERADYAPSQAPGTQGAVVKAVADNSPAWEAGLEAGMVVRAVNDVPLDDIITWRWEADGPVCELDVEVPGEEGLFSATLEREPGADWGLEFTDVLFDGIRTCKNACVFCFMAMLPKGLRDTLYLRDDDYRLSFLQGNFVTLTNVDDADLRRILDYRMEPMNVSIHAVSHDARRAMMGRNEARGLEVLEALCDAGIEVHGQVVLCPGLNDGEELERTLRFVEDHPAVTSLAIVPLGYTKHSKFEKSYSDAPEEARRVVEQVEPYQRRSREATGSTRFQLSDEFYIAAQLPIPPAEHYDGFPQYYDGIGMLRSFLDDTDRVLLERAPELNAIAHQLERLGERVLVVCGYAALGVYEQFCGDGPLRDVARAFPVRNDYFGGDVNVTGLIVAEDLIAQLPENLTGTFVVLPELMLNFDRMTLDGASEQDILDAIAQRGGTGAFLATLPEPLVDALAERYCQNG